MNFPSQWSRQFDGATIERQTVGESGAEVFRVRCAGAQDLFVKS